MIELKGAQLQAVTTRLDPVAVSASAGCGKTTVMVERILSLLADGASLSEMVICTFTKAAAADMRDKLYRRLAELALDGREEAKQALAELPCAQISTLHSFCQQLIKLYFYAIDADPSFDIMSEQDASAMLSSAIETAIEEALAKKDARFIELYEIFLNKRKSEKLIKTIGKIYSFISVQPDFEEFMRIAEKTPPHEEILEALRGIYKEKASTLLPAAQDLVARIAHEKFTRNLSAAQSLAADIAALTDSGARAYGKLPENALLIELNQEYSALKKEYAGLYARYREAMDSADNALCAPDAQMLLNIAARAKEIYGKNKRRKSLADYQDLEHNALKILQGEANAEIGKRFRYLFVDEYQDINPIQESIISRLSAKKFFVGDIKQSIYGFRMCDSTIFAEKFERCESDCFADAIRLNKNHRSADGILNFCNSVFDPIMTREFGRVSYAPDARFDCGCDNGESVRIWIARGDREKGDAQGSVYSVKNHEFGDTSLTSAEAEANLIVKTILEKSRGTGAEGDSGFGGIAVLLRAVSGGFGKILTSKLRRSGILYCMPGKKSVADCPEIIDIISYLRLINNSCDDISCAAVMRSFFGGFTDDELASVRVLSPDTDIPFYRAVENAALEKTPLGQKTAVFLEKLKRYASLSCCLDVSDLAGTIVAEYDYFKYVFALADGEEKAARLSQFLDIVEKSPYKADVSGFLRFLECEMPVLETDSEPGKVKIMTIHSSKGLEFDHVILADIGRKFDTRDLEGDILLDAHLGLAIRLFDASERTSKKTGLYYYIHERLCKKLAEEEMRILYVALTRPKHSLTIIGSQKTADAVKALRGGAASAKSFMDFMRPQISARAEYIDIEDCVYCPPKRNIVTGGKPDPELVKKIREYTDFVYPYAAVPLKSAVTALSRAGADEDETPVLFSSEGAVRGTLYHSFLENMDFDADFDLEFSRLLEKFSLSQDAVDKKLLQKAHSELGALTRGKTYQRELKFIADLSDEGFCNTALVQGVVDLLILDNDGAVIVDYKTGPSDKKKLEAYSRQLDIYAQATAKLLRVPIRKKLLYMIDGMKFIEI